MSAVSSPRDWGHAVLVWLRTAQGSRGAPLICGRALALVMRLAAGTVQPDAMGAATYVDEPILTFVGSQSEQDTNLAKFLAGVLALLKGPGLRLRAGAYLDLGAYSTN